MEDKQVDIVQESALESITKEQVSPLSEPRMNKYGDNFQSHLLDQYKMYVEMADRISVRRGQASTFYISLLSALLALLSLLIDKKVFSGSQSFLVLFISTIGISLCFTWYINIQSYKQLNSLKYDVINEMERELPFPCYTREWQIDTELPIPKSNQEKKKKYRRLTSVEKFIPLIFAVQYFGLFICSLLSIVGIIK